MSAYIFQTCNSFLTGWSTHRPEEASASNVTDVGVAVQLLMQKLAQIFAILANILDEVIFSYDSLNF